MAARFPRFRIRLRGTATFRPISPVVFVPLAEGISSCEVLQSQVRSGPLEVDLRFPYHPHVTVAHDLDKDALDRAYDALSEYDCAFDVAALQPLRARRRRRVAPAALVPAGRLSLRYPGYRRRNGHQDRAAVWARFKRTQLWRAWKRYGDRRGNRLAGATSFFGFLSMFPLIVLAAAVTGPLLADDAVDDAEGRAEDRTCPASATRSTWTR